MPLLEPASKTLAEIPFDGGSADLFPAPQPAAVDPIEMLVVDGLLIGFAGSLARQALAKVAATVAAVPFRHLQFQDAGSLSPVLVAEASAMGSFIS